MRALRTLATVTVTVLLLAAPGPTMAQSGETPGGDVAPLARQPEGLLPLEGTPWRLTWYRWKGVERSPGPEVGAAMTLSAGKLEASGGCTAFKGTYGAVGSAIDFDLKRLKKNDCAEQTTMVQLGMVGGLRKAARLEITTKPEGDELALFNATGAEVLRFALEDVSWLSSGDWALQAYIVDGARVAADGGMLRFIADRPLGAERRENGNLVGGTGCNGFTGDFYRHADVLSFGELNETGGPCTEPAQRQQDAMLAILDATAIRLDLPADRLILTSLDSGDALELRSTTPLEGTTWALTLPSDKGERAGIVTIRLEDGLAPGEGPCGTYAARYATDGLFITFTEVRRAGDDACELAAEEQSLLAALRATVRVDRDPGAAPPLSQVTLLDALGRPTLGLAAPFATGP